MARFAELTPGRPAHVLGRAVPGGLPQPRRGQGARSPDRHRAVARVAGADPRVPGGPVLRGHQRGGAPGGRRVPGRLLRRGRRPVSQAWASASLAPAARSASRMRARCCSNTSEACFRKSIPKMYSLNSEASILPRKMSAALSRCRSSCGSVRRGIRTNPFHSSVGQHGGPRRAARSSALRDPDTLHFRVRLLAQVRGRGGRRACIHVLRHRHSCPLNSLRSCGRASAAVAPRQRDRERTLPSGIDPSAGVRRTARGVCRRSSRHPCGRCAHRR